MDEQIQKDLGFRIDLEQSHPKRFIKIQDLEKDLEQNHTRKDL
jgi:hypothetical protein